MDNLFISSDEFVAVLLVLIVIRLTKKPPRFIINLGEKLGKKYEEISVLTEEDFKKEKDYYRDILKINSPLILGVIDSFKLSDNIFVAELLYLQKIKAINVNNGKVEKNPYFNGNLLSCEKFFLSKLKDGVIKIEDKTMFLRLLIRRIYDDTKKTVRNGEGLLKYKREIPFDLKDIFISGLIITLLIYFLFVLKLFSVLIVVLLIFYFIYGFVNYKLSSESFYGLGNYARTSAGEEINKKLEGLKIFLKDYSLIDEKSAEHLEIWEEYLIYSVIFNQNQSIVEEYKKYIEMNEKTKE